VAQQIKDNCVAVAINGHMLYWIAKTDGQAGEFIKNNRHPSGGNCFVLTTPSGQKLAGGNGGGGAHQALKSGLEKWKELTADERKALPQGESAQPPEAQRCTPPVGGLVLTSYIRNLKRDERGELAGITLDDLKDKEQYPGWNPIYTEPAHYSVWLTEAEWKSLVPAEAKKGDRLAMPEAIQKRLFRFHLVNGTFGLPGTWRLEDIRAGQLTMIVEETAPQLKLRMQGHAQLASDADLAKAKRGYDCKLNGWLIYDVSQKVISRFDLVAVGDYWGGDYEGGRFTRPGRSPLGVSFEINRGTRAADLVPPLVHMDREAEYQRYFNAEKGR
jgi:hypothetical protein